MAKKDVVEEVAVEEEVVVETTSAPNGTTKLVHADGRIAYAHESMIPAYKSGGFKEEE